MIPLLLPTVMLAFPLLGVFLLVLILRKRRKTRWPFRAEHKLLRGPGESLRQRISETDEKALYEFIVIVGAPAIVALACGWIAGRIGAAAPVALGLVGIPLIASYAVCLWRFAGLWQHRQNLFLGWFGERLVGEQLDAAKLTGWRVFHDVPFRREGKNFNIDHIAVGLGGVFLFETKSRRKGSARPGRKDSEVIFNGRTLDWPWGEDDYGLEQAERNALTLAAWIDTELGERVHIVPYLVIPGWWITLKPIPQARLCRVAQEKWLPGILDRASPVLTAKQVDLIARRLEASCRDVEE